MSINEQLAEQRRYNEQIKGGKPQPVEKPARRRTKAEE